MTRRCQQPKADGTPCHAPPLTDRPYCATHDPENAAVMAEARRFGGLRRRREKVVTGTYDLAGLHDVAFARRLYEIAAVDTLALENSVARNRTLAAIAMGRTRLAEIEATIAPPIVIEAEVVDEDA